MDRPTRKQGTKLILESLPASWAWNMHVLLLPRPSVGCWCPVIGRGGAESAGKQRRFPRLSPLKHPICRPTQRQCNVNSKLLVQGHRVQLPALEPQLSPLTTPRQTPRHQSSAAKRHTT